ncbi:MAG: hypothetical protein WDA25_10485 [Paracoccaceae bacterium]
MMPLVLNGFFRSGTSVLWRAIAEASPDKRVLYEPCHPDLLAHIRRPDDPDPLHGFALWHAYRPYLPVLEPLFAAYAPRASIYPHDGARVVAYARGLGRDLGADLVQVNRWHFVLGDLAAAGAPLVHVLRNPFDIYASFLRIFAQRRPRWARKMIHRLAPDYLPPNSWGMRRALGETGGTMPPRYLSRRGLDTFLAVWLRANAAGVSACAHHGGAVFWVEDIATDPRGFAAHLAGFGLGCDTALFARARVGQRPDAAQWARLQAVADRLGQGDLPARLRG